jgi:hypothetical protein
LATYYVDGSVGNDSNAGTSAGSGNAWLTIGHGLSSLTHGDLLWVKASATYSIGTGLSLSTQDFGTPTRVFGYTSTPGDGGRATILVTGAITAFTFGGTGYGAAIANFVFDGGSGTGTVGIDSSGALSPFSVKNCLVKDFSGSGINLGGSYGNWLVDCEVMGCAGTAAIYSQGSYCSLLGCKVHGNTATGIANSDYTKSIDVKNCQVYGNTGASSDGIALIGLTPSVTGCTMHGNGRHGINILTFQHLQIINNIITLNGGYGINDATMSVSMVDSMVDYNWFGSGGLINASGPRSANLLAGPHDLSGDPGYTNAGSGDFTPTNAAVQAGL